MFLMIILLTGCGNPKYTEISYEQLKEKLDNKDTFVLLLGSDTCSAVRYSDATRELEVLLVAASGGKNYIAGKVTYAFSTDDSGKSVAAS